MAKNSSLTDYLDSPSPVSTPRPSGPMTKGFLGGLADSLSSGVGAIAQHGAIADKKEHDDALNQTATGVFNIKKDAEDFLRGDVGKPITATDTDTGIDGYQIPADAIAAAREVQRTQRAASQGRATQDAVDLKTENFVSSMMQKYPDQSDAIFGWAKQNGIEHYMFRNQENQAAQEASSEQAHVESRTSTIKLALDNGYNGSDDDLYETGTRITEATRLAGIAAKSAEEARAAAAENRANSEFLKKQADRDAYSAATAGISVTMGQIQNMIGAAAKGAPDSPEAFAKLQELGSQLDTWGAQYRTSLQNQMARGGASSEMQDAALKTFDTQLKAAQDFISGPTSRMSNNARALQNITTSFGLTAMQALPGYSALKSAFGSDAALAAVLGVGGTVGLSQDLKDKVKADFLNFNPLNPGKSGAQILLDIGALAKGDASLADKPESYWTGDHLRGLSNAARGTARAILDPEPDNPAEQKGFLGSYGNLIIAAHSIQPGYKNLQGINFALDNLTSNDSTSALNVLMKDKQVGQQALVSFQAGRSGTTKLLKVLRSIPDEGTDGVKVVNGRYQAYTTRKAADTPTLMDESGMAWATADRWNADISPQAKLRADLMNRAVDYLVNTAQADPTTKGLDPNKVRDHFINGTPLPAKEGEAAPKAVQDWQVSVSQLEASMQKQIDALPKTLKPFEPNQAVAHFQDEYGKAGAAGIVGNLQHESGLNPNAVGDGGQAIGVAQWHPDRQEEARKQGFDLSNYGDSLRFIDWEFEHGDPQARKAGRLIKQATDPVQAADIFAQYFLRPKGAETGDPNKISGIDQRRANARRNFEG